MNFRRNDPGAVQYGNFINYYQFNSAEERLKLLPTHVWAAPAPEGAKSPQPEPKTNLPWPELSKKSSDNDISPYLVLDVGCNSGVFTQLLWKFLSGQMGQQPVHIFGVDIDGVLVERAQTTNHQEANISFATVDIMESKGFAQVENYLYKHRRLRFDAVCCFSITMWIHLNHHDSGLQYFLRKLSSLAELFVVEPQPWKCYQTAERRMKKAGEHFPLFSELKWRTQVEEEIQLFVENKLGRSKIHECCPTKWKRRIYFYR